MTMPIEGKERLAQLLDNTGSIDEAGLFELLADRSVPEIPFTLESDLDRETQRMLAPIFVHGKNYGTRCSTVLLYSREGNVRFTEKSFDQYGKEAGMVTFDFTLERKKSEARSQKSEWGI